MTEIELYEDLNTLPVYNDSDWDRAIGEWERASKAELTVQLYKGAIVCQIDTVYGEQSRKAFARATGDSYSTIRDYASVYSRIQRLEPDDRSTVLGMLHESHITYSHVLRITPIKDDETFMRVLTQAHDEDWSTQRIAEERAVRPTVVDTEPVEELEGEVIEEAPSRLRYFWGTKGELVDTLTGEVIIDTEGKIVSESAIVELVDIANGG